MSNRFSHTDNARLEGEFYDRELEEEYSAGQKADNDRLDYASRVRETHDWRDQGEIRMGA